ncbi:sterol desaturase family protein [Bacillus sp. FJAT-49736]|uniref:sterol desaturase family protein n=1 Tax=Bacillus sp. FJAT-49736 TaxID=2833582 RepID=UPI001BC9B059|nr:sterol desaturase family protein [Bacillus sp. FJAT-49736]MBS4175101.1 sterol desaturase family protein [Bacillus sp. FJAT-49736]
MKKYLMEFFRDIHVRIMSVLVLVGIVFIFRDLNAWETWLAIVIGMASYTLGEYLTHRFLFHMKPPKSELMLKFIKRIHYDHHVDPRNLKLLFLPVWYSLPNIIIFSLIVFLIIQNITLTIAFAIGISIFLLYYEWTHYIAHKEYIPKTPWGKRMKKIHLWHHYKNENYWYGVTSPTFDKVFGTYKNQHEVEKSETARNLEKRAN